MINLDEIVKYRSPPGSTYVKYNITKLTRIPMICLVRHHAYSLIFIQPLRVAFRYINHRAREMSPAYHDHGPDPRVRCKPLRGCNLVVYLCAWYGGKLEPAKGASSLVIRRQDLFIDTQVDRRREEGWGSEPDIRRMLV